MSVQTDFSAVARELDLPEGELIKEGIRALLEHRLCELKAEIFRISGQYNIESVEGMEARYREGTLEEADSWRDLQRLDRLEFKRDRLTELLEGLA